MNRTKQKKIILKIKNNTFFIFLFTLIVSSVTAQNKNNSIGKNQSYSRERISINEGWRFMKYTSNPDTLIYDVRPEIVNKEDSKVADSKPTEAVKVEANQAVLKNWILPSAN